MKSNQYKDLAFWRPLAEQGDADAQWRVGELYYWGEGIKEDEAEALKWYRKAAEQGHVQAQVEVGFMYRNGSGGVKENKTEAVKWYRKAAEQGYSYAQDLLGYMYWDGEGVKRDHTEAAAWYRKAADQGNAEAQWHLGDMYQGGRGVQKDFVQAYLWHSLAAEAAQRPVRRSAIEMRDAIKSTMTTDQIAEANRLVAEWKPTIPLRNKDPKISELLDWLRERLNNAFNVSDHWEADLCAIGIHAPDNHAQLVYISGWRHTADQYYVELETAPAPGSEVLYQNVGTFCPVNRDELLRIVRKHLSL